MTNLKKISIVFVIQLILMFATLIFLYNSIDIKLTTSNLINDFVLLIIVFSVITGIVGYKNLNLNLSFVTVLLLLFVFSDVEYYKFFSTLTNLSEISMITNVFDPGAGYSFDYVSIIIIALLMFSVCYIPYKLTKNCYNFKKNIRRSLSFRSLMVMLSIFTVIQIESVKVANLKSKTILDGSVEYYKSDLFLYDSLYSSVGYAQRFGYINYKIRSSEVVKISDIKNVDEVDVDNFFNDRADSHTENNLSNAYNDYNVINLTLETFDSRLIHPILTPNLYNLWNTSMRFDNHFTPSFMIAPTCNSEFMYLTSIYPNVSDKWSSNICFNLGDTNLGYTLPRQMSDLGYDTYYMHNGVGDFYNRNVNTISAYGFDESHFTEANNNDLDMLPLLDNINFDEKFYSYMLTYSMHLGNDEFYLHNMDYVKSILGEEHDSDFLTLYTKAIETDNFVGKLIDRLKDENVYDKTLIVVTADHWPYALKASDEYMDHLGIQYTDTLEVHRLGMVIHDGGKTVESYDNYSSTINMAPTILNMVTDNFENQYFFGDDIMSNDIIPYFQEVAIYNDGEFTRLENDLNNKLILDNILINDLSSSVITYDLMKLYLNY